MNKFTNYFTYSVPRCKKCNSIIGIGRSLCEKHIMLKTLRSAKEKINNGIPIISVKRGEHETVSHFSFEDKFNDNSPATLHVANILHEYIHKIGRIHYQDNSNRENAEMIDELIERLENAK